MKVTARLASMFLVINCLTGMAYADDNVKEVIAKRLQTIDNQFAVKSVAPAAKTGLYEVELISGEIIYSTADGQYIFGGTLFEVVNGQLKNLTERKSMAKRARALKSIKQKDAVVFKAANQRAMISVFTDIDCGYCRKLHQEVPRLNELGVTVRYLAYPRAGVYTGADKKQLTASFKKIKSVWCDKNPAEAMTRAKASGFIKDNLSCNAPIEAQFQLGRQLGVRGTPAIMLENGEMLPGYMPADEIAKRLNI